MAKKLQENRIICKVHNYNMDKLYVINIIGILGTKFIIND